MENLKLILMAMWIRERFIINDVIGILNIYIVGSSDNNKNVKLV